MSRFPLCSMMLAIVLALPTVATAGTVVATGDSLTAQYGPDLESALTAAGFSAHVELASRGGLSAPAYTGEGFDDLVVSLDPDLIVFMLGTNDVFANYNAAQRFDDYVTNVTEVFDRYATLNAEILVISVLPFDMATNQAFHGITSQSGALDRIEDLYNPWLMEAAESRGFQYLNLHTSIKDQPNWVGTLMAGHDGLHLSTAGQQWVSEQVAAALTPRPCDFDRDFDCSVTDIDLLLGQLGRVNVQMDLNSSGGPIDLADRDAWLSTAGIDETGLPYIPGDVNFDGIVDSQDLNLLGQHWLQSSVMSYADGDVDGDGIVGAADLNTIGMHWRQIVPSATIIPEPSTITPAWLVGLILVQFRRTSRGGKC